MAAPSEYRDAEKRHRLAGKANADNRRAILEEMAEGVSLSQASRTKRPIERRTSTVSRSRYRFRALAYRREVLARRRLYPRPAATILAPFATWPPWFGCPLWRVRFPSIAPQTSDTRVPAPCRQSSPPFAYRNATTAITFPHAKRIPQRSEAVESSVVGAGSAARAVWSALKGLQHRLAQTDRIALAALRKFNDLLGDRVCLRLVAIL